MKRFCKECGHEVTEGEKFCSKCGTPVTEESNEKTKVTIDDLKNNKRFGETSEHPGESKQEKNAKTNRLKMILLIIGLVLVSVFVGATFFGSSTSGLFVQTINISDFINEPMFIGGDGEGEVDQRSLTLDQEMLYDKLYEVVKDDVWVDMSEIMNNVTLVADPMNDLTNGDEVVIVAEIRNKEKIQNDLGVRFSSPDRTFNVVGLLELIEVDPFEGLEPKFFGASPKVTVEITSESLKDVKSKEFIYNNDYVIYKDGKELGNKSLQIGDTFTIKINEAVVERLKRHGYEPSITEKEYKVTELDAPYYIASKDELDETFFEETKNQAQSIMKGYVASKGNSSIPKYEGIYFLTPKENAWNKNNTSNQSYIPVLYFVFSYEEKRNKDETISKYSAIRATNLLTKGEEKMEDDAEKEKENSTKQFIDYSEDLKRVTTDYDSLEKLYLALIASEQENYTYEATEKLPK